MIEWSFRHEIDCLLLLIQSYVNICDYQYMNSISSLHHMHCVLKEWHDAIENQPTTNHRFPFASTSPLNIFKSPPKPALYTFFSKFHELLIAKVKRRSSFVILNQFVSSFSSLYIFRTCFTNTEAARHVQQ